jgi:Spy/CpxP family protein refolding chaperone
MRAVFAACGEPVREHKRRVDEEIRAALTPEQQRRFDDREQPEPAGGPRSAPLGR